MLVSIDLAVWYEPSPVSHGKATAKYATLLRNEDGLVDHPGLAAVYTALVTRFPRDDRTIWSAEPRIAANAIRLSIAHRAFTRVRPVVEELAEREGLVCFDPERSLVRLPSAMRLLQLSGGVVEAVTEPTLEQVAEAVVQTVNAPSFLILEQGTERYVQMSPALHGTFGVEYRDGGSDRHFLYETGDRSQVKDIFESYARGDDDWRHRYRWEPFQL
jgi:hypothetical protein